MFCTPCCCIKLTAKIVSSIADPTPALPTNSTGAANASAISTLEIPNTLPVAGVPMPSTITISLFSLSFEIAAKISSNNVAEFLVKPAIKALVKPFSKLR